MSRCAFHVIADLQYALFQAHDAHHLEFILLERALISSTAISR